LKKQKTGEAYKITQNFIKII